MMTVWSLTITGVALIAVEVGGWPYNQKFIMQVVRVLQPLLYQALCIGHDGMSYGSCRA